MQHKLFSLLSETSVHAGCGRSSGFVDLPFAREAATDYPVLVGSSVKGSFRDLARATWEKSQTDKVFGKQDDSGKVLISDARLLLLPVRSMTGAYKWVTCPHLLERFSRDQKRAGVEMQEFDLSIERYSALAKGGGELFLEEREFKYQGSLPEGLVERLTPLLPYGPSAQRLKDQLVVLHDNDFAWFARYGLQVNARNVLDEITKESKELWYEETLPADSLFYLTLAGRAEQDVDSLATLLNESQFVQLGGNETVGQGWFTVQEVAR